MNTQLDYKTQLSQLRQFFLEVYNYLTIMNIFIVIYLKSTE